ncbi:hypothetical protein RHGRI_008532 [Rhododendron griersonianum]|uniref:Uncharacterized protein n=1 Tax=Rhododendron griersonianum TaxID=479676 RepID=A0AAV6L1U3_9ERIC|nr:hypothetical protein RHGRI_008532 [Rhododendron griersonianum]
MMEKALIGYFGSRTSASIKVFYISDELKLPWMPAITTHTHPRPRLQRLLQPVQQTNEKQEGGCRASEHRTPRCKDKVHGLWPEVRQQGGTQ